MKHTMVFVALLACSSAAADPNDVLTADGLSDVTIGMPVDRLERAIHGNLAYNPYISHGCSVVTTPKMESRGLSMVLEDKKLTRINLEFYGTSPLPLTIKTDTGVGLGSPEEDVVKAYGGRIRIKPNAADPTWHTLYVDNADHSRGIVFETDGKTVKSIRAGAYPTISNQIPCN